MSELSAREVTAGISRRALDTLHRHSPNGRKPTATKPPGEPGSLAQHLAAAKQFRIETPEKTAVVDTWDRQLDLLNLDGWNFRIRDCRHTTKLGALVEQIALDRVQLEALGRRIHQVLTALPTDGGAQ